MKTIQNKSKAEAMLSKPANAKPPDIAFASVPDTLAMLKANPETGLARAEVDTRRKVGSSICSSSSRVTDALFTGLRSRSQPQPSGSLPPTTFLVTPAEHLYRPQNQSLALCGRYPSSM
jgi:hypothetical protein